MNKLKTLTLAIMLGSVSTLSIASHGHSNDTSYFTGIDLRSYDGQGTMPRFDATQVLKSLGFTFSESNQILAKLDTNNNGISRLEASTIDYNHNGILTTSEIRRFMRIKGIKSAPEWN